MSDQASTFQHSLDGLDRGRPESIPRLLDALLAEAVGRGASGLDPVATHRTFAIRLLLSRVPSPLRPPHTPPPSKKDPPPNLAPRLKVLADLLTYRPDIPQEGRLLWEHMPAGGSMRVSTFPTIHGEKAAVRLFDAVSPVLDLEQLALPVP